MASLGIQGRKNGRILNLAQSVLEQSVNGTRMNNNIIQPEFYNRLQLSCSTLGHLAAVYCVLFDVTGKYIFTGADDNLVKVWSALDGRLLATLRGASSEITDLAVNNENTLLAAGSCDKRIRVWCLLTCAPIAVLTCHSGIVKSLSFCPIPRSRHPLAYLASTSTDGSCAFWGFTENVETGLFNFQPRPTLYQERMRPGNAQMICSSFSPGGIFMAAGSADNNVRVYNMLGQDGPERILEVEVHNDKVDSISWAHEGLRFVSGSKDGTAMIWRFEKAEWRWYRILCAQIQRSNVVCEDDPKLRAQVTMVAWNSDDSLVLTAVSDHLIKVWDSKTGDFVRTLDAHQDEVYVIESHPFNPRLVCTAGHDGRIIIWDIGTLDRGRMGKIIFQHYNQLDQGQGHGEVFDCKWSPDGLGLVATDSQGYLLIFTTQAKDESKFFKLPKEMFFHTDYTPLTRDAMTHEVLDEQTQVPPHLMPPPFLVDSLGNRYPQEFQSLVPGREKGREIGIRNEVPVNRLAGVPNQNQTERRGLGLRRGGVVEGIRQSTGNWQMGNYGFPERLVISPLSRGVLAVSENNRLGSAELEETCYKEEISKRPASGAHMQATKVDSPMRDASSRRVRGLDLEAAERRQRKPLRNRYNVRRMFEDRGAKTESDIENMEIPSEEDSSDEWSLTNSSYSTDDDSESDCGGGGSAKKVAENRKRATTEAARKSAHKSKATSPQSGANLESDDEPTPGPSNAATSSPSKTDKLDKPKRVRNKVHYGSCLEEIPALFRPSEWLGEVFPKRSPYFPQLGDDLVYYREGHEAYINKVEEDNLYPVSNEVKKLLPYLQYPDLEAAVSVRVVNMKIDPQPTVLVELKLAITDWETGDITGNDIIVCYHDIPGVVDFLILRQVHDEYCRLKWKLGDRFRCLIDKLWWVGTVCGFVDKKEQFTRSKFLCYNIAWDYKHKTEKMSPWDMDVIPDSFAIPHNGAAIAASDEELQSGLYEAIPSDWPPYGQQDTQCAKISRLMEQVMGLAISEAFRTPIDINKYHESVFCVEYHIDLSTIKARLDNRFYRRVDALKFDVKYIADNAEKFNRPDSDIVKHARIVRDLILYLITNPDIQDVNTVYNMIVDNYLHKRVAETKNDNKSDDKNAPSDQSCPSQQPSTSRGYLRTQGKSSKGIEDSEEVEKEDTRGWKEKCRDVLEKVWQCKDSAPFRAPVNPEEYPDYYHGESLNSDHSNGGGRNESTAWPSSRKQRANAEGAGCDDSEYVNDVPMLQQRCETSNSEDDNQNSSVDSRSSQIVSREQKVVGSKRQKLNDSDEYSYGTRSLSGQITTYDETKEGSSGDEHDPRKKRSLQNTQTSELSHMESINPMKISKESPNYLIQEQGIEAPTSFGAHEVADGESEHGPEANAGFLEVEKCNLTMCWKPEPLLISSNDEGAYVDETKAMRVSWMFLNNYDPEEQPRRYSRFTNERPPFNRTGKAEPEGWPCNDDH